MKRPAATREKRTDPALLAIVGEGLFSRLAFGVLSFALPLYARSLGLSLAEVGVLMSINSAVAIGLKPVLGWTADRFGPRRTLLVAATMRSAVSLLLVFSSAPWQLFAIRSLHGVSMALRDPAANVLLADRGGSKKVASAFAWYQTGKTVAGSTSKACAGILMGLLGTRYPIIFLAGFVLSSVPLLVVARYVKEVPPAPPAPRPAAAARPQPGTGMRPVLAVAGLGVLVASSAEMLAGLFPVLATEYAGLTTTQTGLVYAASTAVAVSAGPIFGWLSDNVSRKLVLGIRGAANTLSSILYVVSPSFAGVGFARCSDDLGTAAFRPAWGALMSQVSHLDRSKRARIMSWLSMGEDAGGVLGPMLAGFLWNGWGVVALMGARVLLAATSEVYAFAVIRKTVPPPQAEPVRSTCVSPC
ncbi:MAG TPA: MFS transporter [Myxococcales bacterium]